MSQQQEQTAVVPVEAATDASGIGRARAVAGNNLIWIILAVTVAIGATIPGFLSGTNITNVLWSAVPLAFLVLGMFFVMLTGGLDLSLESIFGVAPVIGVVLMTELMVGTVTPAVAVLVTLATGIFAGLMNGLIVVRLRVNPFLVTLATLLFWRGVVIFLIPEGVYYLPTDFLFLGGFRFFGWFPLAIPVAVIVFAVAWVVVDRTPFGKAIYAVGSNPMAAYVAGINVSRIRIAVFVIAGFLAGFGGLIEVGRLGAVVDDLGSGWIMMVFAGTILGGTSLAGGRGRISGIIGAVLELAVIENVMNMYGIEPSVRQVVFSLILLGAIYVASFQEKRELINA